MLPKNKPVNADATRPSSKRKVMVPNPAQTSLDDDNRDAWISSFTHWSPKVFRTRMQLIQGVAIAFTLGSAIFSYSNHENNKYDGNLLIERYQTQLKLVSLKEKINNCRLYSLSMDQENSKRAKSDLLYSLKKASIEDNNFDSKLKREFINTKNDIITFSKDSKQEKKYKKAYFDLENIINNIQNDIKAQGDNMDSKSHMSFLTILGRMLALLAVQFVVWQWVVRVRRRHQSDEEQQRSTTEKLTILAEVDPLTGLRNRRTFEQHLTFEFERSQQQRWPLSLIMVDVDHFKKFNDAFGHLQGDEALKITAQVLQKAARKSDIVVRYGGEEFAMLLPHTSLEDAKATGERLRQIMHETEWPNRQCTASIGVASLLPSMKEPVMLIDRADMALYYAKETGRDRVVHADEMPPDHVSKAA
jgi:diguanylate cyclase (GGDEF)-like protein